MTIIVPLDEKETKTLLVAPTRWKPGEDQESRCRVREAERAFGGGQTRQPSPMNWDKDFVVPLLCV